VAQSGGNGLGGHSREGGVEVSKRQWLAMVKESWLWGGGDQQRRWCVGGETTVAIGGARGLVVGTGAPEEKLGREGARDSGER